MNIISFDPSLRHTGYFWSIAGIEEGGVIETNGDRIDSLAEIYEAVDALMITCLSCVPDETCLTVAVEGYAFASRGQAVTVQAEVGGIIRAVCRAHGCTVREIPPLVWKSKILGKIGFRLKKGTKAEVKEYLDWARVCTGRTFNTSHEADAFMMAELVRKETALSEQAIV